MGFVVCLSGGFNFIVALRGYGLIICPCTKLELFKTTVNSECLTRNDRVNCQIRCFCFFSIQDVCILFALIVVFLVFFNTYIFQAGLVFLLIRKFKTTIIITVLYLLLSLGLHVWTMVSIYSLQPYRKLRYGM